MIMAIAVLGAFSVILKAFGGSRGLRLLPLGGFVVFGNYDFKQFPHTEPSTNSHAWLRGVRDLCMLACFFCFFVCLRFVCLVGWLLACHHHHHDRHHFAATGPYYS